MSDDQRLERVRTAAVEIGQGWLSVGAAMRRATAGCQEFERAWVEVTRRDFHARGIRGW